MSVVDAVVIGSGPNGLVAAAALADAGWDVLVLEAAGHYGGAVHSTHEDGWVSDRCSSCYPLVAASPVMRALELDRYGLRWANAPLPLVHPLGPDDEAGSAIHPDPEDTAAGLEHEADGDAWLKLCADYRRIREPLLDALLTAWPPVKAGARLAMALGSASRLREFARFMALSSHQMGRELFQGRRGRALLAGNAMHADVPLTAPVSGTMGWLLAMLAQDVGFPSAEGGSGRLTDALVARARAGGAELVTGERVTRIEVSGGRAVAVHTTQRRIAVRRAVVADVSAPILYGELLPEATHLLADFVWDLPTVKVNYRLSGPVPWTAKSARQAGVVHLGGDADGLVYTGSDLETGVVPQTPFILVGQTSTADPTRSPAGTEALWAYAHLPRGVTDDQAAQELATRIDATLEAHAPGFAAATQDREVQTPKDLAEGNNSLGPGAVNGGTMQLFQQLVFRPAGLGGPRTTVEGVYLGSAAIHPGGGVHGSCGWLAARAALRDHTGPTAGLRRRATTALLERIYRPQS